MRTTLLLLALLFLTTTLSAQIQRGDVLYQMPTASSGFPLFDVSKPIDGNVFSYTSLGQEFDEQFLGAGLRLGYAITDHIVGGFALNYVTGFDDDISQFSGELFLRYYAINNPRFGLFGQLGGGVISNDGGAFASPTIGISLPESQGLIVSPQLAYTTNFDDGFFSLGARLEVLLATNSGNDTGPAADFGRGTWMLGTYSAGFTFGTGEDLFIADAGIQAHYFFTDRLALGGGVSTNLSTTDFFQIFDVSLTAGPRYYFLRGNRWQVFGEARGGILHQSFSIRTVDENDSETTALLDLGVGIQYFITDNFSLEAGPGYRFTNLDPGFGRDNIREFSFNVGARFCIPRGQPSRRERTIQSL